MHLYQFLALFFLTLPTASVALTKQEAQACVDHGVERFFSGKPIDVMIDIPYMIEREQLTASQNDVAALLNQRAEANLGWYRNIIATVVGKPQQKSDGFFLISGYVRGDEKDGNTGRWKQFDYNYIIWARLDDRSCRIGRLAIEEWFRLGSWVRQNI